MNQQEQKKFDALREMFNSDGWKLFQEEIEESLKNSVESAPDVCMTEDQWQFRRGEIFKLKQIRNYQVYMEAVEENMEEDDA